ncbi:MAG TPA: hypothetical protein VII14_03050 [Xanthobacteraceae bacterium]|jgi:hypothetical protein|nr:hypothetical protein [Alphaproteobacteria bacterium]
MRELSLLEDALANLLSGGNFFEAMDLQSIGGEMAGLMSATGMNELQDTRAASLLTAVLRK